MITEAGRAIREFVRRPGAAVSPAAATIRDFAKSVDRSTLQEVAGRKLAEAQAKHPDEPVDQNGWETRRAYLEAYAELVSIPLSESGTGTKAYVMSRLASQAEGATERKLIQDPAKFQEAVEQYAMEEANRAQEIADPPIEDPLAMVLSQEIERLERKRARCADDCEWRADRMTENAAVASALGWDTAAARFQLAAERARNTGAQSLAIYDAALGRMKERLAGISPVAKGLAASLLSALEGA